MGSAVAGTWADTLRSRTTNRDSILAIPSIFFLCGAFRCCWLKLADPPRTTVDGTLNKTRFLSSFATETRLFMRQTSGREGTINCQTDARHETSFGAFEVSHHASDLALGSSACASSPKPVLAVFLVVANITWSERRGTVHRRSSSARKPPLLFRVDRFRSSDARR